MEEFIYLRCQYRIYPTDIQTEQIQTTADCCRFVHNYYLNFRSLAWRTQHRNMNAAACMADLKYIKLVFEWLCEADSMALQEELKDLQQSFENFWRGDASHPQYRSRKASGLSYRTRNQNNGVRMSADGRYIHIPKLGWTKIKRVFKFNCV
jgi:putative transposase